MDSEEPGLDWLAFEPEAVVLRVTRKGQVPKLRPYNPDDLQKIMDWAAKQFFDSTRSMTPFEPPALPAPENSPPSFPSRRRR